MSTAETSRQIHQGRNIKRFREMMGLKQEALALELGEDWSQKKVSRLEEQQVIEKAILNEVCKVLKVSEAAIENFTEEAALNFFNTFNDSTITGAGAFSSNNFSCIYNPIDELIRAIEENKKLYERLLASEREKNALLQRLVNPK